MNIYQFCWSALAWTFSFAALWPLNVPMAALALRIWRGRTPIGSTPLVDMESDEIWKRSALATLGVALASVAFIAIDYTLINVVELPPGPVHMVVLLGYLAVVVWIMMYVFGFDDFFQAMSLALIYLYVPVFVLFALNSLLGLISTDFALWTPVVDFAKGWMPEPKV